MFVQSVNRAKYDVSQASAALAVRRDALLEQQSIQTVLQGLECGSAGCSCAHCGAPTKLFEPLGLQNEPSGLDDFGHGRR